MRAVDLTKRYIAECTFHHRLDEAKNTHLEHLEDLIFNDGLPGGKAAMVVPTGFLTTQSGIDKKIRQKLVDEQMLAGVISMPSNIFATTGTNVSIIFIDRNAGERAILIDASNLGTTVKEGKNQKTLLSSTEEQTIIKTFNQFETIDDLSVAVSAKDIKEKNYSFSAGQYFEVKIEYVEISKEQFDLRLEEHKERLSELFRDRTELESSLKLALDKISYAK